MHVFLLFFDPIVIQANTKIIQNNYNLMFYSYLHYKL